MSLSSGQVVHGRYRVIALLHQGGMGAVYEAMDTVLDIRCALKEMLPYPGTLGTVLPQLREQFQQEALLLAGLRHPNLPRVTDHFEEDGNAYLVMDFIPGKRLDEIIVEKGGLTEDDVLDWARQLMQALAHCHEQGVIHRDVKPQNVVVTGQGRAVLVDFGLAKLVDPDDPRTRTVMRGLGTPEYAPPEQYDAKRGYTDARTDVYSLGATLYHALAGEMPPTVTERIVNPEILVPLRQHRDDVSGATERGIAKAMALQPSWRFQDVAEMYEALFGSPLPEARVESVVPFAMDAALQVESSEATISLPRIVATKLRIDRRLGTALVVVSLVSLATVISLVIGGNSVGDVSTATATPTVLVTMTSTHTPTVTPSSTATPTASPTLRRPTRWPTETPDELDFPRPFYLPSATPTPTPTRVYVRPSTPTLTPTSTPVPTNTLRPYRPRPAPTRTPTSTTIPIPTDTPTPIPTNTSTPRPTP